MADLFGFLLDPAAYAALATLIVMEVVLGIDNLIFISILTNKLPVHRQQVARRVGIGLALVMRLGLLATIAWIIGLTAPVFAVFGIAFSWKDMILIGGGLFLVYKATTEIHHAVDPVDKEVASKTEAVTLSFASAVTQILALDLVFSLDSIITAVGMTDELGIMIIAVIVAVMAMLAAAGPLARFIERNPTIVMLALGFLLMIGMTLIAEGFHFHVEKGYVYAAMAFSAFIELLNMLGRHRKAKKGTLRARPSLSAQR
jgi:predicted tellurium resistance membrane protein TerC